MRVLETGCRRIASQMQESHAHLAGIAMVATGYPAPTRARRLRAPATAATLLNDCSSWPEAERVRGLTQRRDPYGESGLIDVATTLSPS